MNRFLALLLSLVLTLTLCACGGGEDTAHVGTYTCTSVTMGDATIDTVEGSLDLQKGGKGTLTLSSESYSLTHTLEDGTLTLYLHGAKQGRKLDVMRANPKVFFEMECDLVPFAGDVACRYGLAYRSLMGRGRAVLVDDPQEKVAALVHLMKTQTGEDGFVFDEKLASIVSVIRIDVTDYTAKHRPIPDSHVTAKT